MQRGIEEMEIALRVLKPLTERTQPAPGGVEALLRVAPQVENSGLDELICDVIQQALKRRAEIRKARATNCGR